MNKYDRMTDEQLLCDYKNGNQEIMDYLMVKYKSMVRKKARAMYLLGGENEDLIQEGMIGLIKAVVTFNADKGNRLAAYASKCIENEILMYLRRNSKTKMEVSIDEPLNVDWDGNELLLSDILGTDEDIIYRDMENEAEIMLLRTAVNTLTPREKEIICLRYGIGRKDGREMTQKEVADLLGISQSYISRLEKKIMVRLKKSIQNNV